MIVEKSTDKNYPFTIKGGWGDKVYCTLDDLKDIKNQINKILREVFTLLDENAPSIKF